MKKILSFLLLMTLSVSLFAQQENWVDVWSRSNNFYEIKNAFNRAYNGIDLHNVKGWKPYMRWQHFYESRVFPHGDLSRYQKALVDHQQWLQANAEQRNPSAANWSLIGPSIIPSSGGGAGRVNRMVIVPGANPQFICATPGGGMWRFNNSWTTTTDQLASIGFGDVEAHPSNNNIFYAISGDNDAGDTRSIGVFKSTDGGSTWSLLGLSNITRLYDLIVNPLNGNSLIVSSNSGIYKSTDGGVNWQQVNTGTNVRSMRYKPNDTTVVYAAQMNSTSVLLKSTNGGLSFAAAGTGLPTATNGRAAIAVTAASASRVYIVIGNPSGNGFKGLYMSTDDGNSFTTRSTTPNLLGYNADGSDTGGQQWYDLAIDANPVNADQVVVGGVNVWRSDNGGQSWSIIGHWTGSIASYVHADIHDLRFTADGSALYTGCDGGIFRKDNVNSTTAPWTDLSSGMAISQLYGFSNSSTSNYKILAGWQDNGTTLYDGPNTWRRVIGGDGMQCIIDYSDNTYQYGTIYYGRIYRSVNGGSSFSSVIANSGGAAGTVNEDGDWVTPYVLNPRNPTSLYVGKTRIYKSDNRGNSWTALGAFPVTGGNIDAIAISPSDTNTIYASKSATIAKSTDGGANWTTVSTGLPGWFITSIFVDNRNKNNVYITCGATSAGQQVYQSQDGGASWASISGGLPALPANSIVMDTSSATRGLYVGLDAGVYYRDNNSGFWTLYNTNLPNVVINQLEIQYGVRKLRACTYGRGIWESDLASGSSPQQVLAAFTANRNSICRGEQIQYTDASLGGPTTWSWNFQGGTPASSTQRNPSVTYNTNGTYNVSLTVTNVNGDNTLTSTGFVTVSSVSPTLSITGTTEICAGSQASFTVNGTNLGSPANYTWLRNGTVITSTAANSFATAQLSNGDVITASTTSTANCAQPATVNTSNSVSLLVKPTPPKPTIEVLRNVPLNLLGNPGLTSANNINLGSSNATGNRWYFNGSTNTFSSDRVIRPVQAGSYQVVSTLNGCNSAPSDVYVLGVDRMEDLFKLYPVPSNGELIMEYFSVLNGSEITVNVISAAGQIVYTKNFNSVLGLNTQKLGLQTLASGQYTLQLQTVNRSYQKTFLIQLK